MKIIIVILKLFFALLSKNNLFFFNKIFAEIHDNYLPSYTEIYELILQKPTHTYVKKKKKKEMTGSLEIKKIIIIKKEITCDCENIKSVKRTAFFTTQDFPILFTIYATLHAIANYVPQ